jgi:hypothetical protein
LLIAHRKEDRGKRKEESEKTGVRRQNKKIGDVVD